MAAKKPPLRPDPAWLKAFATIMSRIDAALGTARPKKPVVACRRIQRRALFRTICNQLNERDRIHHRARQNMGADLRTLFQDADIQVPILFGAELFQANRRGQSRRAGANDHNIEFHGFAFHEHTSCPTGHDT